MSTCRLHHVSLIVADTARSLTFYRDLLGLEVAANRPDLGYPGAWLQLDEAQICWNYPIPTPWTSDRPTAAETGTWPCRWMTSMYSNNASSSTRLPSLSAVRDVRPCFVGTRIRMQLRSLLLVDLY